jgi:hypothetical protein
MFKGIATAAFGLGIFLTVAIMVSQPESSTAGVYNSNNTTIVKKNSIFPLKEHMTVEPCSITFCADV